MKINDKKVGHGICLAETKRFELAVFTWEKFYLLRFGWDTFRNLQKSDRFQLDDQVFFSLDVKPL